MAKKEVGNVKVEENQAGATVQTFVNIIRANKEKLTVKERYDLTLSQAAQKLSNQKGQAIDFDLWALYETPDNKSGEVRNILSIRTPEGEVYSTNSDTFIREFLMIADLIEQARAEGEDAEFKSVIVMSGTSKAGREFITAVYNE